jgi:hypothetical protein
MCKERGLENDSDVLIECRDVYKSFGEKHILKGVSFKVFCCVYSDERRLIDFERHTKTPHKDTTF